MQRNERCNVVKERIYIPNYIYNERAKFGHTALIKWIFMRASRTAIVRGTRDKKKEVGHKNVGRKDAFQHSLARCSNTTSGAARLQISKVVQRACAPRVVIWPRSRRE